MKAFEYLTQLEGKTITKVCIINERDLILGYIDDNGEERGITLETKTLIEIEEGGFTTTRPLLRLKTK